MHRKLDIRRIAEGMESLDQEYLIDNGSEIYEQVDIRMLRR